MKLVAQRVVRPSDQATGINAYCYLHRGRHWLDVPPPELGRGVLANRLIELDPPAGNRVRSYLVITTPDSTSNQEIGQAVLSGADIAVDFAHALPWSIHHAGTTFEFNLESSLVDQWEMELRILLGYALEVRE